MAQVTQTEQTPQAEQVAQIAQIAQIEQAAPATRVEHDLVGDKEVPAAAYYGVHTARAVENFAITGSTIAQFPDLIAALAAVKQAAATANRDLGLLTADIAGAIIGRLRRRSAPARCTTSSSSTRSKAAPAPRRT